MILDIEKEFQQHIAITNEFYSSHELYNVATTAKIIVAQLKSGNKIISIGNGGSMSDAMHFASELSGKFRAPRPAIAALALSDPSALTCIANDFGFNQVFKRQIEAVGKEGDVLLALSTSGNSENILVAAEYAKRVGIKVVSICGKHGKLREYSDVVIEIPHEGDASRTQELTILIIHILVMLIEKTLYP
jgi:D-sedoheptulose 7-phosphate isomerase